MGHKGVHFLVVIITADKLKRVEIFRACSQNPPLAAEPLLAPVACVPVPSFLR
jgi:hypothetical protein